MNVQGALNHRVWGVGVHYIEDRMNYLIALDPKKRRAKDLFRFGIPAIMTALLLVSRRTNNLSGKLRWPPW
jgi:hypothetical protein